MLSSGEIASFRADGFVAVRGAVPRKVAEACADAVWVELEAQAIVRDDPSTRSAPVVRIVCPDDGDPRRPFVEAGTARPLWQAYDQLIGPDRWWKREGMGGTIPVRFPSTADPRDAGWHIETSYWSRRATCSSATPSSSTPRHGRTGARHRGS